MNLLGAQLAEVQIIEDEEHPKLFDDVCQKNLMAIFDLTLILWPIMFVHGKQI